MDRVELFHTLMILNLKIIRSRLLDTATLRIYIYF